MASEENVSDVKRKLCSDAGTGWVWLGWVFTAVAWEVIGVGVSGQEMTKMLLPLTQGIIVLQFLLKIWHLMSKISVILMENYIGIAAGGLWDSSDKKLFW